MERELGTNIEIDTGSDEDIEEIFNEKMREAEKKQQEKADIESDRAMFEYDRLRGK